MDALPRYWCEIIRLEFLMRDAVEFDLRKVGALLEDEWQRLFDIDSRYKDLFDWLVDERKHRDDPPAVMVSDLLYGDEAFDGDRLPRIDNLARIAIEQCTSDGQEECIKKSLSAIKRKAEFWLIAARDECDCEICKRHHIYGEVKTSWDEALLELGLYIAPEFRDYTGEGAVPNGREMPKEPPKSSGSEMPDEWHDLLSKQACKLVCALWDGKPKTYTELHNKAWSGKAVQDNTIVQAVKLANIKLEALGYMISRSSGRFKLGRIGENANK
jgi:hypothetical protein